MLNHKKIGLALGGGGAKGLAHIAFLKAFDELGIKPSIISGSSMGAFIGALYASGLNGKELETLSNRKNLRKVFKLTSSSLNKKYGLIKGDKIMSWFREQMKCQNFEDLRIPLKILVVDFWKGEEVILDKGNISDAVRASISIPGVFQPVDLNNKILIDGGVLNPVPYDIIRKDCDILVAIDVMNRNRLDKKYPEKPNIFECIFSSLNIMGSAIERNKIIKPDIHVKASLGKIGALDFHRSDKIFENVETDVKKFRRELKNSLK